MHFLCSCLFQFSSFHTLTEGITLDSRIAYYEHFFLMHIYLSKTIFCLFHLQACKYEGTPNYVIISKHKGDTGEFTGAFYLQTPKGNQANALPFQTRDHTLKMLPRVGYSGIYPRETNEQKIAVNYFRANISARLECWPCKSCGHLIIWSNRFNFKQKATSFVLYTKYQNQHST